MDEKLKELINIIKAEMAKSGGQELILFGSHATNSAKEDSDYDFLIIVNDSISGEQIDQLSFNIRMRLWENDSVLPMDLVFKKKEQYRIESASFGSLAYNVKLTGVAL